MPITVVGNTKGGTGKSNLAVNLAVEFSRLGEKTLLLDTDDQLSAMSFYKVRKQNMGVSPKLLCKADTTREVGPFAKAALENGFEQVVIDGGGRDTDALRASLLVADLLIIPVQPMASNLWAIGGMIGLVNDARKGNKKLKIKIVVNLADASNKKKEAALDWLKANPHGFDVYPQAITRRMAFDYAFQEGKAVSEYTPKDPKAIEEITTLFQQIDWELSNGN